MGDSNWKKLLKSQHADLEKLEAMDAELNDVKIAADIENALRKTKMTSSSFSFNNSSRRSQQQEMDNDDDEDEEQNYRSRPPPPIPSARPSSRPSSAPATRKEAVHPPPSLSRLSIDNESNGRSQPGSARGTNRNGEEGFRNSERERGGEGGAPDSPGDDTKTPDATARYQKARLKLLAKQVEDGQDLRKQLSETVNDLQRQLKNERDENKKAKKRIQLLEVETKRSGNKKMSEAESNNASDIIESLSQEISMLKKDIQTAERIGKQAEVTAKAKETHLKRAMETIGRLKNQVSELQMSVQGESSSERTKIEAAESRVKLLERQRADLITAFKKQMKLIDVLRRQKVHIEAARLLAFTEEEFVRTLDWGA